jgi:hypothetical protein
MKNVQDLYIENVKKSKILITNKNSKYYGEAVVQSETPKTHLVRLLKLKKPTLERLGYRHGKVGIASSPYVTFYINKSSVEILPELALIKSNAWQNETLKLLEKYEEKTKEQVIKMLRKKNSIN